MDYRRIAGTDLDVSVLCFGPMRAAEKQPGVDSRSEEGAKALAAALDSGINFVHSSYEYGVRWLMNRVLKDHPKRHEIHHIIKVPVPDWEDDNRFSATKFRLRIEEALKDLAAERIAVLQWMWRTKPDDHATRMAVLPEIVGEVAATFERLRDEGKAGYLMTFPYTVPAGRLAVETLPQNRGLVAYYNPLEMEMAELFPALEDRGQGFLCIRPIYQGILTDKRPSQAALADGDRLKAPQHAPLFERRSAIAAEFADEIGGSMTRFAMRFPLFSPLVASVIVGLNGPRQVEEAVGLMDGIAPRPDLVARAAALWRADFVRAA